MCTLHSKFRLKTFYIQRTHIKIALIHFTQAKEMEREKNLLLHGTGEKVPSELGEHPVFMVNQKTNDTIQKKRSKVCLKILKL